MGARDAADCAGDPVMQGTAYLLATDADGDRALLKVDFKPGAANVLHATHPNERVRAAYLLGVMVRAHKRARGDGYRPGWDS